MTDRTYAIMQLIKSGKTRAAIARQFGVSCSRIGQIVNQPDRAAMRATARQENGVDQSLKNRA